MGREKILIGKIGEKRAQEFLRKRGYKLMELNYRTFFGEIDAVAKKGDFIVFIEIKTRTSSSLGPPYLSVTYHKQKHIIKNALLYLKRWKLIGSNWRIDVVSVKLNYECEVEHIEIIENAVENYKGGWL